MKFKIQRYDCYWEEHPYTRSYNHEIVFQSDLLEEAKQWLYEFIAATNLIVSDNRFESDGYIEFEGTEHDMESITYEIIES
jgi:hypothetical protein